ncbi:hypothetical protein [Ulvibacterium marinum]|uniref:Uncharacterized protein n=1 Tax=Ulvibacterium marinum TaxID=2419782 RepID=A0A3B0C4Y2_9FLAO|nr:hypothetical protein [Ulvibacterium marinum]RKN81053.1 hypothetical protein D7Z94_08870 [Ulvibacterium marinum]
MKLTNDQIEEAAYIFEKENGHPGDDYTKRILAESELTVFSSKELEKIIVDGFDKGFYNNSDTKTSAYWALSKRFNHDLIPFFNRRLKSELEAKNSAAVYQLLIALGNMGVPVFNKDREGGSAIYETELNLRDAKEYLKRVNKV